MKIELVGIALQKYFQSNKFKILLSLDQAIVYVCAVLEILFIWISGGTLAAVLYFAVRLGVILAFANSNYKLVTIGLGSITIPYVYSFLKSLIMYRYLALTTLVYVAVYGILAFLSYKKSIQMSHQ